MAKTNTLEILWAMPEQFALAIAHTLEGEHIASENARVIKIAEESAQPQEQLVTV